MIQEEGREWELRDLIIVTKMQTKKLTPRVLFRAYVRLSIHVNVKVLATLWSTWLQHENKPARPVRYHTLREYRRDVTVPLLNLVQKSSLILVTKRLGRVLVTWMQREWLYGLMATADQPPPGPRSKRRNNDPILF
ncbi:hypothetical protein EVAR_31063_1 [Eumeta japonica]|uniref:Uncharacterized protein n=1 Tax=Eumeta variegata TaxID=151549 RepID=A0A4C1XHS0_EUMVA|nr:hypothetical protein EVAR_31063_1 [Eumeta japonica]